MEVSVGEMMQMVAWARAKPPVFDEAALVTMHAGTHRSHGEWRVARGPSRTLYIFSAGAVEGVWYPCDESTDGELDMLAALAARTLRMSGGFICGHRTLGSDHSIGWSDFKALVDWSHYRNMHGNWAEDVSGGPPYKHWGPLPKVHPVVAAVYDEFCREWVASITDDWRSLTPCPLQAIRPFLQAWPDPTVETLRDSWWQAKGERLYQHESEREMAALFAERLARVDIAEWHRTGRLPAPKPRPLAEADEAWRAHSDPKEWVYILRERDGDRIKIGKTEVPDPMCRIRSHQTSSSQGRHLDIIAVMLGPQGLENIAHQRFDRQRVPGKCEWYFDRGALAKAVADRFVAVGADLYVQVLLP